MKKLIIDEKVCKKHKIPLPEFLCALAIKEGLTGNDIQEMLNKGIFTEGQDTWFNITPYGTSEVEKILEESSKDTDRSDEEIDALAKQVRLLFPQGKRPDSNKYFRNNFKEIAQHLKKFFSVYGDCSNEEILDATKRYVESFHGNYMYMKLDKYFIIKDLRKEGGDVTSDLATWLDNKREGGESNTNDDSWLMNSRN